MAEVTLAHLVLVLSVVEEEEVAAMKVEEVMLGVEVEAITLVGLSLVILPTTLPTTLRLRIPRPESAAHYMGSSKRINGANHVVTRNAAFILYERQT